MKKTTVKFELRPGNILIATPELDDTEFARTVILIVTREKGTMGVVMNQRNFIPSTVNELLPELKEAPEVPLYNGGILEKDILFVLHSFEEIKDGLPLDDGMFMNGDFDHIQQYLAERHEMNGKARFFIGYAGWGPSQLEKEIEEGCWIVSKCDRKLLLESDSDSIWTTALKRMGKPYSLFTQIPRNVLPC